MVWVRIKLAKRDQLAYVAIAKISSIKNFLTNIINSHEKKKVVLGGFEWLCVDRGLLWTNYAIVRVKIFPSLLSDLLISSTT
jgi:hypothetical protein